MERGRVVATVGGFLAAIAVLAGLVSFVGVSELLAVLASADRGLASLVVGLTGLWLICWGLALWTILGSLGAVIPMSQAVLLYAGAAFANNVTPFGQAGGEPVTALLVAESRDLSYERGLAAITGVDTANFVPSVGLALIGVGYLAITTTLGRALSTVAVGIVGVGAVVVLGGVTVWQVRRRAADRVAGFLARGIRQIVRLLPRGDPPGASAITTRVHGFVDAVEQIGTHPRRLGVTLGFSALGWGFQMVALWVALRAVGAPVSLAIPVVVVPLGAIAGATPLPGGVGGIEAALVALLVAAPVGVSQAAALGAVVLFRGAVYWLPTLVGGAVAGVVAGGAVAGRRDPG
jgi:conserved hypothetical protein